jgi:manganese transport protein
VSTGTRQPAAERKGSDARAPAISDAETIAARDARAVAVSDAEATTPPGAGVLAVSGAEGAATPARGLPVPSALEELLAKGRVRATLAMLGPAFVAAVAYVDPGNFATNVQAGAKYGYLLLWVVLAANLIAMLIQYLSAKLGIASDRNLAENVRAHYPRAVTWGMWVQAEVMAMSTDIAEFLGASLGLNLLFGVPLFAAGLITGVIAFAMLGLQSHGFRRFELAITALLGLILAGFIYETLRVGPSVHESLRGLIPGLHGTSSIYLAVGIVGATVMPHVIYLHSALTNGRMPMRDDGERSRVLRFERLDVIIALGLAGAVNMAMLVVAAKLFHTPALSGLTSISAAHAQLGHLVGGGAALAFAVALLASGVSSSSVGTYAGQVVMAGFVNLSIPIFLRRALTMTPALIVLAAGVNPTDALVLSQVVLSFGIPFALVPLVMLTSRRDVMGVHVNRSSTRILAWACASTITALNIFLIYQQFFG